MDGACVTSFQRPPHESCSIYLIRTAKHFTGWERETFFELLIAVYTCPRGGQRVRLPPTPLLVIIMKHDTRQPSGKASKRASERGKDNEGSNLRSEIMNIKKLFRNVITFRKIVFTKSERASGGRFARNDPSQGNHLAFCRARRDEEWWGIVYSLNIRCFG